MLGSGVYNGDNIDSIIQEHYTVPEKPTFRETFGIIRNNWSDKVAHLIIQYTPDIILLGRTYNEKQRNTLQFHNRIISFKLKAALENGQRLNVEELPDQTKLALAYLLVHAQCYAIPGVGNMDNFLNQYSEEANDWISNLK